MDTETLRWFQHVADGATVTEVAEVFMVSQPGVSRALARLEAEVGVPLLSRHGRLLRPTQAGATFKSHVDALLHELDDGLAALEQLMEPETGTVRIGFQPSFGTWLVPRLIAEFRLRHPHISFRLEPSHVLTETTQLTGGAVDLQLTAHRTSNPAVGWGRLFRQPFVLLVPPGHVLAGHDAVGLADVRDLDFVMLGSSWELRRTVDDLCRRAGFTPRVAFEGEDLVVVRALVDAGLGVAVVPAMSAWVPGRSVPLSDEGAGRDVGLAWSLDRRLMPSAELFRAHVLAHPPTLEATPRRQVS